MFTGRSLLKYYRCIKIYRSQPKAGHSLLLANGLCLKDKAYNLRAYGKKLSFKVKGVPPWLKTLSSTLAV